MNRSEESIGASDRVRREGGGSGISDYVSNRLSDELRSVLQRDLAIDVDRIGPDDRLIEDLGMDSVAFAIALVAIEDHTGLQLSGDQLAKCRTVGEVDALIRVAQTGDSGSSTDARQLPRG